MKYLVKGHRLLSVSRLKLKVFVPIPKFTPHQNTRVPYFRMRLAYIQFGFHKFKLGDFYFLNHADEDTVFIITNKVQNT